MTNKSIDSLLKIDRFADKVSEEQFRKCSRQFNDELRSIMTKFRHLTKTQQETMLHDLEYNTLYTILFLKQIQKQDQYIKGNTGVAQRYG